MSVTSSLRADLYNAPAIPTNKFLPDGSVGLGQPTVVTLMSGKSEAVLVDTLFTSEQGVSLGDWIQGTLDGKKLSTIYITHGHGDHWFNLHYLIKRFPGVEVVSTQDSIDHMSSQLTPEYRALWHDLFPEQIDEESFEVVAKPLKDNKFTLEGHTFEAVNAGHSDMDATTFLYVPSLNLTVAGDIATTMYTCRWPSLHLRKIEMLGLIVSTSSNPTTPPSSLVLITALEALTEPSTSRRRGSTSEHLADL